MNSTPLKKPAAILILVLLTVLVYANSLRNPLVWDDRFVIVENSFVKSWKNLPSLFDRAYLTAPTQLEDVGRTNIGAGELSYRPVVTLSYFADYSLFGLNPLGWHIMNLIWHIANVLLLFVFAEMLLGDIAAALLAALLFAIHPVHSEILNVMAFRKDILAFFFMMASLILYIKLDGWQGVKRKAAYGISLVLFFLALFSKEMALTLPLILIAYDWYFRKEGKGDLQKRFQSHYLGYLIVAAFYLWVWWGPMARQVSAVEYPGGNFYSNILTMAKVFTIYVHWLLLPLNVHVTIPNPAFAAKSLFQPEVFLSVGTILLLVVLALMNFRKNKVLSFGIVWFFVTLLPVANLIPIQNIMAARYLYIPSVGFALVMAVILRKLWTADFLGSPKLSRQIAFILLGGILVLYVSLTAIRNYVWENDLNIRQEVVAHYPDNALAYSGLGNELRRAGAKDLAIQMYRLAVALEPRNPERYNDLGVALRDRTLFAEALTQFQKAKELDPSFKLGRNNLCGTLGEAGQVQEAIVCSEQVTKDFPAYAAGYFNLGVTYANVGRNEEARVAWEKTLQIDPGYAPAGENLKRLGRSAPP